MGFKFCLFSIVISSFTLLCAALVNMLAVCMVLFVVLLY